MGEAWPLATWIVIKHNVTTVNHSPSLQDFPVFWIVTFCILHVSLSQLAFFGHYFNHLFRNKRKNKTKSEKRVTNGFFFPFKYSWWTFKNPWQWCIRYAISPKTKVLRKSLLGNVIFLTLVLPVFLQTLLNLTFTSVFGKTLPKKLFLLMKQCRRFSKNTTIDLLRCFLNARNLIRLWHPRCF